MLSVYYYAYDKDNIKQTLLETSIQVILFKIAMFTLGTYQYV